MIVNVGPWHFTLSPWDALGFVGQAMFFSRFLVQWIASERAKRSYVPTAFWWLSLAGGSISLVYAIGIHNIVFTLGQAAGLIPYVRNLMLVHRQSRGTEVAAD
jgi:lipid-A-disaccharide synthase-like uncharacterized protein